MGRARCLCGAVSVEFDDAAVDWRSHCHCESCRRATSSPITTFFNLPNTAWRWTSAAPAEYRSSPDVTRFFCATCGSPMGYRKDSRADEMDFYAASLETPEDFRPEGHSHWDERLLWLHLTDDLPRESG